MLDQFRPEDLSIICSTLLKHHILVLPYHPLIPFLRSKFSQLIIRLLRNHQLQNIYHVSMYLRLLNLKEMPVQEKLELLDAMSTLDNLELKDIAVTSAISCHMEYVPSTYRDLVTRAIKNKVDLLKPPDCLVLCSLLKVPWLAKDLRDKVKDLLFNSIRNNLLLESKAQLALTARAVILLGLQKNFDDDILEVIFTHPSLSYVNDNGVRLMHKNISTNNENLKLGKQISFLLGLVKVMHETYSGPMIAPFSYQPYRYVDESRMNIALACKIVERVLVKILGENSYEETALLQYLDTTDFIISKSETGIRGKFCVTLFNDWQGNTLEILKPGYEKKETFALLIDYYHLKRLDIPEATEIIEKGITEFVNKANVEKHVTILDIPRYEQPTDYDDESLDFNKLVQ